MDIQKTLKIIEDQTGIKLKQCDHFNGVYTHKGESYFNAVLKERTSESKDFNKLQRFYDKYKTLRVKPNGLFRIAIFQTF